MDDFISFQKIENINKLYMTITQKINGSNAQIYIKNNHDCECDSPHSLNATIQAASRTRWLTPDDDNHRFCKWVMENRQELIETLGEGRHYGEWCGSGINTGEGLPNKMFCLFDWLRWHKQYPDTIPHIMNQVRTVPILYSGKFSLEAIDEVMTSLKTNGSQLVPGYMKPEGIVMQIGKQFYKKVFEDKEVSWSRPDKANRIKVIEKIDIDYLLQPYRLLKLLMRDEKYMRDYPVSLSCIAKDYCKDLEEENQLIGINEEEIAIEKKALGRQVFGFIKSHINKHILQS